MGDDTGQDLVGSERDVLLYYLNKNRDAVVRTLDGLTDEQQRTPGVPSGTNLLGLVQHLTGVEVHWFERVFLDDDRGVGESMDVPFDATRDEVVAAYRAACARSDEIVRACPDLSTMAKIANPGEDEVDSLRRIVSTMIEETARHAGHADILASRSTARPTCEDARGDGRRYGAGRRTGVSDDAPRGSLGAAGTTLFGPAHSSGVRLDADDPRALAEGRDPGRRGGGSCGATLTEVSSSSRRLLSDSRRPITGRATTLSEWRIPMIRRIPPTRATSSFSCSPVDSPTQRARRT